MNIKLLILLFLSLVLGTSAKSPACTTMAAGKGATADGSIMIAHSDDALQDPRLIFVPAQDHKPGSKRAVYYNSCAMGYLPEWNSTLQYRMVSDCRAAAYNTPINGRYDPPLGFIPEVAHTYAYFDNNYGIMNEHQLLIGECTDKAKVHTLPEPGKRIMYSAELSRIALERCKTAREAIQLMGELIRNYGYYGTGETLLVGDTEEAWVLEMCSYDKDGTDGVWVAKRVPDDEIFVAANQFRIREVLKDDPDMMYSENIFAVAKAKGWWREQDGELDFAKVYGDGEFHHPYYSKRRVWRAFSLFAPSLKLPAWVKGAYSREYPFSVKPDAKIDHFNIFRVYQDNYEGTEFDLTKGLAAGPFGNPNRFEGGAEAVTTDGQLSTVHGNFERPINIYRCAYSYVAQARGWLPEIFGGRLFYAPDRAATSALFPMYAGISELPHNFQIANLLKFDHKSIPMTFNYVANYVMLKYDYMIKDLRKVREKFEGEMVADMAQTEEKAAQLCKEGKEADARKLLDSLTAKYAENLLRAWWELHDYLYITYEDGYINTPEEIGKPVYYPAWWLKAVGVQGKLESYRKPE